MKETLGDDYFVIGTDYFKTKTSLSTVKDRKNYTYYSADPLSYKAKRLGTYYLRFDDLKENEKLSARLIKRTMKIREIRETQYLLWIRTWRVFSTYWKMFETPVNNGDGVIK